MADSYANLVFDRLRYFHAKPEEDTPDDTQGVFIDPYRIIAMFTGTEGEYFSITMLVDIPGNEYIGVTVYDTDQSRLLERIRCGEDETGPIPARVGRLRFR